MCDNAKGEGRQRGLRSRGKERQRDIAVESRPRGENWGDLSGRLAALLWRGHLGAQLRLAVGDLGFISG